jgi:signal transduction histidine kinase
MKNYLNQILDVPTSDPDDARRRRLLNILLIGLQLAALLVLAGIALDSVGPSRMSSDAEVRLLLIGIFVLTLGIFLVYLINRRVSGRLAGLLFLFLLLMVFILTDSVQELVNGRSLFLFTLPIIMASILLSPGSSFVFAVISSMIISFLAWTVGLFPNIPAITGFFLVALASWLSARSLDQALQELRSMNAKLDRVVTERTQALAESLEREHIEASRNQAILNSIADGVVVFDPGWNAILANPALKSMLDLPVEQIVNRNFRDLIEHPALASGSRSLLYAMMEQGTQPLSFRIEWGNKTLSISAAQVYERSSKGHTNIGTVTVFRDFTREAEVEKLKSTFVAIVSHELRTPLNAILGYAEMFKEAVYGPMNDKQINTAGRIIKNTQRLLALINDLLDQAQMEAGKLTIQAGPVRPVELLENLHGVMDQIVNEKGLTLTSEIEDDLPEVLTGDPARLQQILVNLVNNGVKFTEQGTVHVRLACPQANRWRIEVSDTGRGIPASEIPYIFDPFRQVDGAATRVQGGFGLGLSIVKQLVHMMNGEIKVKSLLEQGSTFSVTLPLVVPAVDEEKWRNL